MGIIITKQTKKPELLAPAGSLEAFFAAMEKGADAIYVGMKDFSARAKAKNFTAAQMGRMIAYAHSFSKRVYVAINTLVKEDELPKLVELLAMLEEMRVDGVIVQDMAVARLTRRHFPGIPLHASTQMTIHNSLGIRQLEDLGFVRVVLARELHIDEISAIVAASQAEIECFIHGALCFSISGQCYFSSLLGGHSGNRGRCAQPCRRQYRYKGKEGYYFSTNDFSSIEMIPDLCAAGVASLKIEGRMKSAEYVASVVAAYRLVMDAPESLLSEAVSNAKELLKLSFGRAPTKGFLASHNPSDIATPSHKGATGLFLGVIRTIRGKSILFETKGRIHVGDRIRIQPKNDMAGRAFTIKELFANNGRPTKEVKAGTSVTIPAPFSFRAGDTVFKVSSETAFNMSENACLKRLESIKGDKLPCDLTIELAGESLKITAIVLSDEFCREFSLGPLKPARTPDMAEVLRGQFSRTADTIFRLTELRATAFPSLLIPTARLKDIRREFYQYMAEQILNKRKKNIMAAKRQGLAELMKKRQVTIGRRPEMIVRLDHLRDFSIIRQEGISSISLPISKANLHQLPLFVRKLHGHMHKVQWRLPFIIFEVDLPFYKNGLTAIIAAGFHRFEAANLSHFPLLKEQINSAEPSHLDISTDYRLFSLNSQALMVWQELGANAATLYIEDDAANITQLLAADLSITKRVLVYGKVPVITSKITIRGIKSDTPIISDRKEGYHVVVKDGLTVVTANQRFSLTGFRSQLQEMGCNSFIIDLGNLPRKEWHQAIEAFNRGVDIPGTSPFNFEMGLV